MGVLQTGPFRQREPRPPPSSDTLRGSQDTLPINQLVKGAPRTPPLHPAPMAILRGMGTHRKISDVCFTVGKVIVIAEKNLARKVKIIWNPEKITENYVSS